MAKLIFSLAILPLLLLNCFATDIFWQRNYHNYTDALIKQAGRTGGCGLFNSVCKLQSQSLCAKSCVKTADYTREHCVGKKQTTSTTTSTTKATTTPTTTSTTTKPTTTSTTTKPTTTSTTTKPTTTSTTSTRATSKMSTTKSRFTVINLTTTVKTVNNKLVDEASGKRGYDLGMEDYDSSNNCSSLVHNRDFTTDSDDCAKAKNASTNEYCSYFDDCCTSISTKTCNDDCAKELLLACYYNIFTGFIRGTTCIVVTYEFNNGTTTTPTAPTTLSTSSSTSTLSTAKSSTSFPKTTTKLSTPSVPPKSSSTSSSAAKTTSSKSSTKPVSTGSTYYKTTRTTTTGSPMSSTTTTSTTTTSSGNRRRATEILGMITVMMTFCCYLSRG